MSDAQVPSKLQLPASLQAQMHALRRRLWHVKSVEALGGAIFGITLAYLLVFGIDRLIDTPTWARVSIFCVTICVGAFIALFLHHWIWRHRRSEQLAQLIGRRFPTTGDQLLGIIELVRNEFEQARSRALCEAAIRQVAQEAGRKNLNDAVPRPRHRLWMTIATVPLLTVLLLAFLFPAAAANAWARFLAPLRPTPRFTFTALEPLPEQMVVPHGEPVTVRARLRDDSSWRPEAGNGQVGNQPPVTATLQSKDYEFKLAGQLQPDRFAFWIGDAEQQVALVPMLRPELSGVSADIQLPAYLQRKRSLQRDARGGALSVVNGSVTTITLTANRTLSAAFVDNNKTQPNTANFTTAPLTIDTSRKLAFQWQDEFGLQGQEPFTISITSREDDAPSVRCEGLPRQRVVLDSETLSFQVRAQDDFGVKRVGIEWQGTGDENVSNPAHGERILAAGGSEKEVVELPGTFCAKTFEIEPQPLNVRIFVEDYLPGRERVYSPSYLLYVLNPEQHSIWLTEQLSKWHRQSLEVRDREMQLHHANQQLRILSPEELDQPETRRRIEAQSAAERANGRRLGGLVSNGEDLVRQAMRNPEFGVGHLDKWADMLQILKDISSNRMPNVADLLKQSSQSPNIASTPSKASPTVGQVHQSPTGSGTKPSAAKPKPNVPQIVDKESSQQPANKNEEPQEAGKGNSSPRLTLPVTTVAGAGRKPPSGPAEDKLDQAIVAQQDLLAEFEKVADELNKVLANLEGSTLVKRLKAASRKQYVIAGKMGDQLAATFGTVGGKSGTDQTSLSELSQGEMKCSQDLSMIMDDMQAYFERRRFQRFKTVLDEMREQDAVGSLRQLSDDLKVETGMSIAQSEFWSDTFDRWADNLVDPACCGKCPGGKSKASLPPSVVLEAMQILEAEVNLREETRVAEQSKTALETDAYSKISTKLQSTQQGLSDRIKKLGVRIRELPDGESEFAKEIDLLARVELVMDEAADVLGRPDTGSEAIAAETEAIELLLQSKKINPRGGGGGGSSPGGGGTGTTNDSALALIGTGLNEKELREDHGIVQTTGVSGNTLPEEFRAGLDEYFNQLERGAEKTQ